VLSAPTEGGNWGNRRHLHHWLKLGRVWVWQLTLDKGGDPAKVKVDRECFMTSGEAEVTNSRLPKGYLYVPLDAFASGSGQGK
jgi:hypothetical protein